MTRLAALLFTLALAPAAALAADPPGRVGRLAWIEGEALTYTDPETGWEGARVNTHLTSENSLWTEPRSRAEVRAGSLALRLEEATQLDIARLEDMELVAHLARGSVSVRVRYFEKGETIVVTTPQARFQLRGNGRFRIDADAGRGESRLTVFEGSARLDGSAGAVIVDTGRTVVVTGGERPSYGFETAVTTPIDEWALAREERFPEGQASRYVSPRMTGWEDLDQYGEWRNEPEYGTVWFPSRVEVGWAPYRYGRWSWVRPWGWTWVDDAPWGYAPFHYGRWVNVRNRWGWYPGRYDPRPVWAPALVGWVGGSGWSLTINSGPVGVVGWYPLSPWDRYEPWYRVNPTYVTHVNRVVIVDRRPPHPVHYRDHATVATRDVFGSRRSVRDSIANVPRDVVARQPVVSGSAVLPPANVVRTRPGTASPGTSSSPGGPPSTRTPPGTTPGRPVAPPPTTPPAVAPAPSTGRPVTRPRDERPQAATPQVPTQQAPAPFAPLPTPAPQPVPPATTPPARPAFTPRSTPQAPTETSRPAAPAMPAAPARPASPATSPSAVTTRPGPRPDPSAAPATPSAKPGDAPRPAEAPVQRSPRGAPSGEQPPRVRPDAPREARPARPESAPPSAARPVERPPQPSAAQPQRDSRPPKEDKPPKESGQKER